MREYCVTNKGKIYLIWSDNVSKKSFTLIALESLDNNGGYDITTCSFKTIDYADIAARSRELTELKGLAYDLKESTTK